MAGAGLDGGDGLKSVPASEADHQATVGCNPPGRRQTPPAPHSVGHVRGIVQV